MKIVHFVYFEKSNDDTESQNINATENSTSDAKLHQNPTQNDGIATKDEISDTIVRNSAKVQVTYTSMFKVHPD